MEIQIQTLQQVSPEQLLETFNASFAGYFVPLQLTLQQFQNKLATEQFNPCFSAGAFHHEQLVGFIIHGADVIAGKKKVYNAGTGVIPAYRGNQLTKKMYAYVLPLLQKENVSTLQLEVITQNETAIQSYMHAGYEITRKLVCYRGQLSGSLKNSGARIQELHHYDWSILQKFWDFTPSWQNDRTVMEKQKSSNQSYGAFVGDVLAGYIIFNPSAKRIQQLAVHPGYRRQGVASALLHHTVKEAGTIYIINVDDSSIVTKKLLHCAGLNPFIEQYEMTLKLR